MRFFSTAVAALAAVQGAYAVDTQKSIIVSFPSDTADDVVNSAKDEIRKAGGIITHEYQLIKYATPSDLYVQLGFAAKASEKIIETMSVWSAEFNAVIEEDQVVEINKSSN
ncbi:hypothetical protein GGS23DRAFT_595704 [Durotheca rogersii]|uniref:uncharacterized protein n=1 Tax=Durotheca rogersii TaxID=419775 RepID=UPI002220F64A|nr:uncharacterized protein GGS23DRAFT_595704 [Durotheca rogersii]KAI5864054.1 hypothetical protein GGS23DRAFT_595704 [Durotheca rogersii]